jgi:hypothetical protein
MGRVLARLSAIHTRDLRRLGKEREVKTFTAPETQKTPHVLTLLVVHTIMENAEVTTVPM